MRLMQASSDEKQSLIGSLSEWLNRLDIISFKDELAFAYKQGR